MNADDISQYYYCFVKLEPAFKADGRLYKFLQKAASRLIATFEGPHLRHMFHRFDEIEELRLNTGVKGRLMDRAEELMKQEKIKGFDVNSIYQNTRKLPPN